ncbi:MAG TPA: hypothetical protein VME47_19165 [Acetobacteraceae bacterium]|nr:hypothetical protein [Acetobacteraceae bacterium]
MMSEHYPDSPFLLRADALLSAGSRTGEDHLRAAVPPGNRAGAPPGHGQAVTSRDANLPPNPLSVPTFKSILFPPGLETERAEHIDQPPCFVDLNLDQAVAAIVAKRDEEALRPIFHATYRNEDIIRYRQAVFADLERAEVFQPFPAFGETMRTVRTNLAYADKIAYKCHRHMVLLRAIHLYCEGVRTLLQSLEAVTLRSAGLTNLRRYLADYAKSDAFSPLATEAQHLRDTLSRLTYGTLYRGDKVAVRKYASEPDYRSCPTEWCRSRCGYVARRRDSQPSQAAPGHVSTAAVIADLR